MPSRILAAALLTCAASQTLPSACMGLEPEVLTAQSGSIVLGDPTRRTLLPSYASSCTWEIKAGQPSAVINVTVDWVYLAANSSCIDRPDDGAFLYFMTDSGSNPLVCWQEPYAAPMYVLSADHVFIGVDVINPRYAYGFGFTYCIGSNCTSIPSATLSPARSRTATLTRNATAMPSPTPGVATRSLTPIPSPGLASPTATASCMPSNSTSGSRTHSRVASRSLSETLPPTRTSSASLTASRSASRSRSMSSVRI